MDTDQIKQIVKDFLNKHRKAVFATVDENNHPHTALMFYAVDDELNFYIGTKKSYNKYGRMKRNPRVSLSVVEDSADPKQVVEVSGEAGELTKEEENSCKTFMQEQNPENIYVADAEDFVMFRIKPATFRWIDATSGEIKITNL